MELWDIFDKDRHLTGRLHRRGEPMKPGDYHLVVNVWIQNGKGEYLISRRTPNKEFPNLWECTGGSALAGDTSLMAALREVKEELGIDLLSENGKLLGSDRRESDFRDIWLFRQDVEISSLIFQEDETNGANWATQEEIHTLRASRAFVPTIDYLDWLFNYSEPFTFFPQEKPENLTYSVITAMYKGKWLFVKHRERDTYEIPGGRIEEGENPLDAARRELYEESGAKDFCLWPVCPYGVSRGKKSSYGMLYFAHIKSFEDMPEYEIEERLLAQHLPENLTYPAIQPKILMKAEKWLEDNKTRVYFIRHAEPDFTVKDETRPLTPKGKADAEKLAESMKSIAFDRIYSSPYNRATETVMPLANKLGLSVLPVEDFCERAVGAWVEDFKGYSSKQWADFNYKLEKGECLKEVQARNILALARILKEERGRNIAIGTHGTALSTIVNYYNHDYGYQDFMRIANVMPYVLGLEFLDEEFIGLSECTECI